MSEPVDAPRPALSAGTSADIEGSALLSVSGAARLVGCSRSTILRRIETGELTRHGGKLHRPDVLRVCMDLIERDDGDDMAADTDGQGGADRRGHPGADTLASAAHVEWLQELVDAQRAALDRKDRELREAAEQAERRERVWLAQLDALTTKLLPAPEPMPEPPRSFLRRVLGG